MSVIHKGHYQVVRLGLAYQVVENNGFYSQGCLLMGDIAALLLGIVYNSCQCMLLFII